MLKMRLQRYGRKNQPSFRVVVTDSRNSPKTGNHVDLLGSYDPKLGKFQIDGEKAKHWISKGVQVSDTVHNFLVSEKVIEGKKINVLSRKSPIIDEAKIKAEAEAKEKADEVKEVNGEAREAGLGHAEAGEGDLGQADAKAAEDKVNGEAGEGDLGQEAKTPVAEEVAAESEAAPEVVAEAAPVDEVNGEAGEGGLGQEVAAEPEAAVEPEVAAEPEVKAEEDK